MRIYITAFLVSLVFSLFLYLGFPFDTSVVYENKNTQRNASSISSLELIHQVSAVGNSVDDQTDNNRNEVKKVTHIKTPSAVKGIYMTSCVAGTPSLRQKLIDLVDTTELNTIVLDIKSYHGRISFPPRAEILKPAAGGDCFVPNLQDIIADLHARDMYVVARLAVFQDAFMVEARPEWAVKRASATTTPWRDRKGIPWIDAGAKPYWDYIVTLAQEAHAIGVDEINFDYIRFPSDGNMDDVYYPWSGDKTKREVMREFFAYLHTKLSPLGIVIPADIFGMTTVATDDLNIGQVLEDALPYFDFISPMVYPSHFPDNFYGLSDPNAHVYEVIKITMDSAVARTRATTTTVVTPGAERIGTTTPALYTKPSFDIQKIRPWLQDNNYPVPYTAKMVRDQIQATYDSGLTSWLLWNAGNRYTQEALLDK